MKYATTYFDDVKVGDELPPLTKGPLQQIQLTRYAGASGDFNPIHQDHEFAKAAGMGDVFAHGMLSMGFVGQLVTDWAGAGNVRKLGVRFAGIVRLKDTITCRGRVLGKSGKDSRRSGDLGREPARREGRDRQGHRRPAAARLAAPAVPARSGPSISRRA